MEYPVQGLNEEAYQEPFLRIFDDFLPKNVIGNVPWVGAFLKYALISQPLKILFRKARTILVSTYERSKRYQRDFELQSHTLYNQHRNKMHILKERLESEIALIPSVVTPSVGGGGVRAFEGSQEAIAEQAMKNGGSGFYTWAANDSPKAIIEDSDPIVMERREDEEEEEDAKSERSPLENSQS
jgi:hypothetical protein